MPMDAQSLYMQLGRLVETMPDLEAQGAIPVATHEWLARAYNLVGHVDGFDAGALGKHTEYLAVERNRTPHAIRVIVYRALAVAELNAPIAARGAFIPAGNVFDAMVAVGKVLATAKRDLLIIDPYMDEKALSDFAPLAPKGVKIRLLADQHDHKKTLGPASRRWGTQHTAADRPLEARLAPARSLHDRVILVDGKEAFVLTQSLNAFAARAPASIVRADDETAALKVAAYEAIWNLANPL